MTVRTKMTGSRKPRGLAAPFALPVGFVMLLDVGTVAAGLGGKLPATGVLIACAVVAGVVSFVAEPIAAPVLALIGWLTTIGFAKPPYADLRPTGPAAGHAAIALAAAALAGAGLGVLYRWSAARFTLVGMGASIDAGRDGQSLPGGGSAERTDAGRVAPVLLEPGKQSSLAGAIHVRRRLYGAALALAAIPLLTLALVAARPSLDPADDLLIYLVIVVATAVIGGFWPAVLAAVAASLLVNWYFTPPLHTFTIGEPRNLLALVLFVTVAVAVSSVVHLAARRAVQAARAREEAAALLALAQTVLGGADSPAAVLDHLTRTHGGQAELQERVGGRWIRVVSSAVDGNLPAASRLDIRSDLILLVTGQTDSATPALLAGYAAQAA